MQLDGSSCGFWVATLAFLLSFSINIETPTAKRALCKLGTDGIKEFWIRAATSFRSSDGPGLDGQIVKEFLEHFKGKGMSNAWVEKLEDKKCVSRTVHAMAFTTNHVL